ncbi:hypothetical protein FA95DRAFT_1188617 [Auriscalpium vulgare]|uniref:Uncharacterized protein n=1 Tax=Auriscalpium vulgare TaxID=40419 RepID=A0ACB8R3F3_9AGAM|nr:hypothetical protein FA95DRAFT_1188617 [Auriscalpium vulgare]
MAVRDIVLCLGPARNTFHLNNPTSVHTRAPRDGTQRRHRRSRWCHRLCAHRRAMLDGRPRPQNFTYVPTHNTSPLETARKHGVDVPAGAIVCARTAEPCSTAARDLRILLMYPRTTRPHSRRHANTASTFPQVPSTLSALQRLLDGRDLSMSTFTQVLHFRSMSTCRPTCSPATMPQRCLATRQPRNMLACDARKTSRDARWTPYKPPSRAQPTKFVAKALNESHARRAQIESNILIAYAVHIRCLRCTTEDYLASICTLRRTNARNVADAIQRCT